MFEFMLNLLLVLTGIVSFVAVVMIIILAAACIKIIIEEW